MAVTAKAYGSAMTRFVSGDIDYATDTIKCALTTASYVPNQDTHDYADDITNELTGGNYARQTLATKTVDYTAGTNELVLSCANITFANLTAAEIRLAVFFKDTGVASTSPLIAYMDFGANQSASGQNLILEVPADGILKMTAA